MRPNTPRIRKLLADLADAQTVLADAATPEQAADARETIHGLKHSLWLAGADVEELA